MVHWTHFSNQRKETCLIQLALLHPVKVLIVRLTCLSDMQVYDVYKPGAHVARSKRVFPLVACHVAMSSSSLPRLQVRGGCRGVQLCSPLVQ